MDFEYDSSKSESNFKKHGINFDASQALWDDHDVLELEADFKGESRFLTIGKIDGKHWVAISTKRKEKIRIISVRRARKKEIILYESY